MSNQTEEISILIGQLRDLGCAVIVFTENELRGADAEQVEDRLIELGWDVIDMYSPEDDEVE